MTNVDPQSLLLRALLRRDFERMNLLRDAIGNMDFTSLLHLLCSTHDDIEAVKYLIENGADVFTRNPKGELPFEIATNSKCFTVASLLKGNSKVFTIKF